MLLRKGGGRESFKRPRFRTPPPSLRLLLNAHHSSLDTSTKQGEGGGGERVKDQKVRGRGGGDGNSSCCDATANEIAGIYLGLPPRHFLVRFCPLPRRRQKQRWRIEIKCSCPTCVFSSSLPPPFLRSHPPSLVAVRFQDGKSKVESPPPPFSVRTFSPAPAARFNISLLATFKGKMAKSRIVFLA